MDTVTATHSLIDKLEIVATAPLNFEVQSMTSNECPTPGPSNTFVDDGTIEVLDDTSYTIVEADDKGTHRESANKSDTTTTTYWGCKQCDFR